jgi:glycosyltransferase involved in cell wall biosynthesis
LRWLNLVKVLSERGWTIDVLTVRPSVHDSFYDASLLKELPPGIRVYRSFPGFYYSLLHSRKRPALGFPKTTLEWLPFGIRKGAQLSRSRKYDILISSALPFVGHLIGYFLKRRMRIPWVVDYGDPLSFNPTTSSTKRLVGRWFEGRILRRADGLIAAAEGMREDFLAHFPFLKGISTRAIPSGIPGEIDHVQAADFGDRFVISYAGSFYRGTREPYPFFRALQALIRDGEVRSRLSVLIAGSVETAYLEAARKLHIQDSVQFLGRIPFKDVMSILKGSSVILYIGSHWSHRHFQYKIFEYAASGRPIIAIRQVDTDLGAAFIEEKNLGRVVSNDPENIARAIAELFDLWKRGSLDRSFAPLDKDMYTWGRRGKEVEDFINPFVSP